MSAPPPYHKLFNINVKGLSKFEIFILEGELFTRLCKSLSENFFAPYTQYFNLIKINIDKENILIDETFIRSIMNDMITTKEYTIPGIAYYTNTPEDIIYEIATGRIHPSLPLGRRIMEMHRSIRPELYNKIISKIKWDLHLEHKQEDQTINDGE